MHHAQHTIPVSGGDTLWAEDTGATVPRRPSPGVGDSRIWDHVVERLVPDHRVIRYDVRGYGRSPSPTGPYSLLPDLVAVLDHFGLDRAALVGCSMGGGAALTLAVEAPERVRSLVLLCPAVGGFPWSEDTEYDDLIHASDVAGLTEYGLRESARAGADPVVVELMRSAAKSWINESVYEQEDPPVFDRLGEITAPSVLLVGDLDDPEIIECDEAIAERVPGCRLVRLPGVDHLPSLRVPDLVAETIRTHCAA
ncbi:alpha/beta fold hydrolase [Streptomyces clavuligerus]|nr:alpha/beta fold hydrolase [Streptomyces clavuligerus]